MTKSKKMNLELYKKVYLIRSCEEKIIELYDTNEMKTPMHMSMGSEAIYAGVCEALGSKHQVYGTYRSHGLYLAKTLETKKFFAEMYGKSTGVVGGKGGSMHLLAPDKGLLGVSAIVGSTIPTAIGSAFANKYFNNKKIVAVFFGDGALDEGVFWESLNVACLMNLPVLFILEDNGLAVHTPIELRHGYKSITDIVKNFNCKVFSLNTTDPEKILNLTKKALVQITKNKTPIFLHLNYYRYLEHVGVKEDFSAGYRDRKEFISWLKIDPLMMQRKKLVKMGITEELLEKLEEKIDKQIEASIQEAKIARSPQKKDLIENIFYEKN